MVVLIKVFEKFFKILCNFFIVPWSVLEFGYEVQSIDHRQVIETFFVFLYVLKSCYKYNNLHRRTYRLCEQSSLC